VKKLDELEIKNAYFNSECVAPYQMLELLVMACSEDKSGPLDIKNAINCLNNGKLKCITNAIAICVGESPKICT